jgi:thiol-disulfide isomerase/thioredoxin
LHDEEEPAPPVVTFVHATELDAEGFLDKVERAANSTKDQEYHPFVLFHVSWCQHCRHTLPEFERAAELLKKAKDDGKLKGLEKPVKYFLIQCDKTPEMSTQCLKHAGTAFPVLKLFRDKRAFHFTGPRWAKTMAEWTAHLSRPSVLQVETKKEMDTYGEHGALFMMKMEISMSHAFLQTWVDLAFDYLEDHYFSVVPQASEASKLMPPPPSVTVIGRGMEPLPFEGKLNPENLKQWVFLNRWPVVVDITAEVAVKLMNSKQRVVVYAYKYRRGVKLDSRDTTLRERASELRRNGDLIFASLDCAERENADFLSHFFPVVHVPGMFAFYGNMTLKSEVVYWEEASLAPADLSLQRIEDLLSSSWAEHGNSTTHWVKGWTKRSYRFATGSLIGVFLVIFLPAVILGLCCLCIREMMMPDEEDEANQKHGIQTLNGPQVDNGKAAVQVEHSNVKETERGTVPESLQEDKEDKDALTKRR